MEGTRWPWPERGGLRAVASLPGTLWGWWEILGPWGPPALSSLWTQSELLPKTSDVETDSVRLDWTTSRWWTLENLTRKTEAWNLYVQPQSCFLGPDLSQLSKALDLAPPPPLPPCLPLRSPPDLTPAAKFKAGRILQCKPPSVWSKYWSRRCFSVEPLSQITWLQHSAPS